MTCYLIMKIHYTTWEGSTNFSDVLRWKFVNWMFTKTESWCLINICFQKLSHALYISHLCSCFRSSACEWLPIPIVSTSVPLIHSDLTGNLVWPSCSRDNFLHLDLLTCLEMCIFTWDFVLHVARTVLWPYWLWHL